MIHIEDHMSDYECSMYVEYEVKQLVTGYTNVIVNILEHVVIVCKDIINNKRKE